MGAITAKTIALLYADLETSPIGTRSRLTQMLGGRPILGRTVDRLAQCKAIDAIIVTCPAPQAGAVSDVLSGTPADVRGSTEPDAPYRRLVTVARKWSLDGWRGGLGGSSAFDEYTHVRIGVMVAQDCQAEAVVVVPPGAALIDPLLCDAMVDHFYKSAGEVRMTFAQAPPGLAPTIFQPSLLADLARNNTPPGWALAYKPHEPAVDLAFRSCCFPIPQPIRHASGRLSADTARSLRTMEALIAAGAADDAESIGRWLIQRGRTEADLLPRELEIELTTDDLLPSTRLRPRGGRVPRRGPLAVGLVERMAAELTARDDDVLVVLGGHGDPLLHPEFAEVLAALRKAGVFGLAVMTTGQQLADDAVAAIIEHKVDAVVFLLDAYTRETYAELTGGGDFNAALAGLERLLDARRRAQQPTPTIVPQITKCLGNLHEVDAFFDGWIKEVGCATIGGFAHYGNRIEDLSVVDMTPPERTACLRLTSRCVVHADGAVVACDQDFGGDCPIGHLADSTLQEIWTSARAGELRDRHRRSCWSEEPLCVSCVEWHRP